MILDAHSETLQQPSMRGIINEDYHFFAIDTSKEMINVKKIY